MSKDVYKLPGNQKYLFYCKENKMRLQIQWYKLFLKKKGIIIPVLVKALDKYKEQYLFSDRFYQNLSKKAQNYYTQERMNKYTLEHASDNFGKFLEIVTSFSGVSFSKRKKRDKDYDDWWQENNLNGGFAYNGVTNDF